MPTEQPAESNDGDDSPAGRDIVVPLSVYKAVVVFSTLFAGVGVVGGFMALDAATNRARAPISEVNLPLAVLGLGLIVGSGALYAFASRFRAPGMGTPKNEDDEGAGNG